MKNIFILLFISLLVFSCQQDQIPAIGEKTDYKPMLIGTWDLMKFEQVDADAESKNFPAFATRMDLTSVFAGHPYTDFSITFNADGTFTSNQGTSYIQIIPNGTWAMDDLKNPSSIILTSSGKTQTIVLGSLADVIIGKMQFKEERKQAETGKVKIKYVYSLTKK
jgi:hypothetical protein